MGSKYVMSRMSMQFKDYKEITPKALRQQLRVSPSPVLWYNVMYLNRDKSKGLIYCLGDFFLLEQKSPILKGDNITYNKKGVSSDYVIHMLDTMIRREKLQKIRKKMDVECQ